MTFKRFPDWLDGTVRMRDFEKWRGDTAQKLRELVENLPKYPDDVGGMYPYEIQMYSADVAKVFAKIREFLEAFE
jgi:hypothetical protein